MSYSAYVTTIKNLRKHTNADRLLCCDLFNCNVIVDLTYHEGERVIYFPVDGQLGEQFAKDMKLVEEYDENGKKVGGGYLNPKRRNIRAIKLRGEQSDGLVLPLACLEKYGDISGLKDGFAFTEGDNREYAKFNGVEICRKYIPDVKPVRNSGGSANIAKNKKEEDKKVSYPYFAEHVDTAQLAYNQNAFKPGDTIYLTRKLHGSSFRVSNTIEVTKEKSHAPWLIKRLFHIKDKTTKKYAVVSGTRRVVLRDFDGGYYGSNEFRRKYNDIFKDILPKGMTVYGEIVGWVNETTPIMPRCSNNKVNDKAFRKQYGEETVFTYGCKPGENDCYIYRITMTNEDGVVVELPTEDVIRWCEIFGAKYVPLLEKFLYTTWEDLNERCKKYLDVPESLANGAHVTEGVVVRIDNRPKFTAYKTKSFYFKILEGLIKDTSDAPDMEEADGLIAETNTTN